MGRLVAVAVCKIHCLEPCVTASCEHVCAQFRMGMSSCLTIQEFGEETEASVKASFSALVQASGRQLFL